MIYELEIFINRQLTFAVFFQVSRRLSPITNVRGGKLIFPLKTVFDADEIFCDFCKAQLKSI